MEHGISKVSEFCVSGSEKMVKLLPKGLIKRYMQKLEESVSGVDGRKGFKLYWCLAEKSIQFSKPKLNIW